MILLLFGASVGGVEALSNLVTQFPEDLEATICIVQHVSPNATGQLAQILDRAGPLPATMAQDCESFELGHIYMAPPDRHLLVKQVWAAVRTMEDRVRILDESGEWATRTKP
jgi:two-component system chemotaxis response regulator CheB